MSIDELAPDGEGLDGPDHTRPIARPRVGSRAILGVFGALVVGCASSLPSASAPPASVVGVTSSAQASAGQRSPSPAPSSADLVVGGDRPLTVHVPSKYDPGRPAPLLVVLHGYGSSGREHEAYFQFGAAADQRGFLSAYPDGTIDSTANRFWNATDACCDFDRSGAADDAYLSDVIGAIEATLTVDPKRIYLLGHSNGGFMSYRMACDHADQIAAVVSLAGATFAKPADCAPSSPVGVLQIHGTLDDVITFQGGTIEGLGSGVALAAYPGALTTVGAWANYDGCGAAPSVAGEHVDVDADLSAAGATAEASITRWTGCDAGGAVELWTMPGGSHDPNFSNAFPDAVLDFLEAHPKP